MKPYPWVICTLLLVSMAQILLRMAVLSMPSGDSILGLIYYPHGLILLVTGLGCYLLSLLSWTLALRHLSLALAYPLLSISYIIVWITAVTIPSWDESFSWQALAGIGVIIAGIICLLQHKT